MYNQLRRKYYRKCVKVSDLSADIENNFVPLAEISNNRTDFGCNRIAECNRRLGLQIKRMNSSSRSNHFIPMKKTNPDLHRSSESPKDAREFSKEKFDPKLILCNEEGFSLYEFQLELFLRNQCSDIEALRSYFASIINTTKENCSLMDLRTNLTKPNANIDNGNIKYDKIMKEISNGYKREIGRAHV